MFSVIIPIYNKFRHFEKCLISVFNQTFRGFELIIVNDGSTDGSLEILKEICHLKFANNEKNHQFYYGNIHVKLVNQENMGVSLARNIGVNKASFDFLAFLDADDWWESTYLEEMKNLLLDYPGAGIYGSNYYLVKNGKKKIANIGVETSFKKGVINYCRIYANTLTMPIWTGATIIPKRIFEFENGFNPILKLGEDFDLWIRVALKYPVVFQNKPLANYNQDVELTNRAVGYLYNPKNHMIWNLEYLAHQETINPDFKHLIDKLRVYILFPYYINNQYHEMAARELKKVNWYNQQLSHKIKYAFPVLLLKLWHGLMKAGSRLKQKMVSKGNII